MDCSIIDLTEGLETLSVSPAESISSDTNYSVPSDEMEYEPKEAMFQENTGELKSPILKSLFSNENDALYFPRTGEFTSPLPKRLSKQLYFKISKEAPRVVRNTLKKAGFEFVTKGLNWVGYWGNHFPKDRYKKYHQYQKINHFPMSFEIGRKDKLYKNYKEIKRSHEIKEFDYLPKTYVLPIERKSLENNFHLHRYWILKPVASARGLGIKLITKKTQIPLKKDVIISRFIKNPYLINSTKFDLRIYVLVTSFEPLRIYVYKNGICRFASKKYNTEDRSKKLSKYAYLTNYSISKKGKKEEYDGEFGPGGKYDMTTHKWFFLLI